MGQSTSVEENTAGTRTGPTDEGEIGTGRSESIPENTSGTIMDPTDDGEIVAEGLANVENLRTSFDVFVARQPEEFRRNVQLILDLPRFDDHPLYNIAMRRPAVFLSFVLFQMRLAASENIVLQFTAEEVAIGKSAEALADFMDFRGLFEVLLREHKLHNDEAYTFLYGRPAGDTRGQVLLTLDAAHERSLLNTNYGDNPVTDRDTYRCWRAIHLFRLAMPRGTIHDTIRVLEGPVHEANVDDRPQMSDIPTDFCYFASAFLHAAEQVDPGFYEAFRDGPPGTFLHMMMFLYIPAPDQSADCLHMVAPPS